MTHTFTKGRRRRIIGLAHGNSVDLAARGFEIQDAVKR